MDRPYHVLFLCTGNSARSIIAEALMNRMGEGRFRAFSAGSFPKGAINPGAVPIVERLGYAASDFRSKSWDEFAAAGAPHLDFVFTVCDDAAGEICPVWPGHPVTAHWGIPDPAAVQGHPAEVAAAFGEATRQLRNRITAFVNLPLASLDRMTLDARLREIGSGAHDAGPA
ncbi:arsenate reductase ArsC [Phenylobacterium sp. J367]|uniref:arsenate reductase ArsC n=1 Tax=Phenylobacterium sp. J367 TaxID=2898435 RepID=UPI002150E9C4|nr:arsenate reductase ArsC [Phenylobacterium sp. J367]MCR5878852.1 arsenate reductase ArsC [Phenylobacterium sp. J367]